MVKITLRSTYPMSLILVTYPMRHPLLLNMNLNPRAPTLHQAPTLS